MFSYIKRSSERIFIAHNISESMFINSGYDFEQYLIKPSRANFDELRQLVEENKELVKCLIVNPAVINRLKETYKIDLPVNSKEREKIAVQPGDILFVISPVEKLTLKVFEQEGTTLPVGVRLKLIKYQLVPRSNN